MKDQATRLADQGHPALAVDLYRGKVATTSDMAHEITRGVAEDRVKRDLHAAFEFLSSHPKLRKDRIGSIGWCMGGGYSLDVALQEPDLAADVINYGHLATDAEAFKKIKAPILGLFGGQDHGITPTTYTSLSARSRDPARRSKSRFTTTPAMLSKIPATNAATAAPTLRTHGTSRWIS